MAYSNPSPLVFLTMENSTTFTGFVEVQFATIVDVDLWGTWGSATFALSISRNGGTTYHAFTPAPDPTAPTTGVAFAVTADLNTCLRLPPCLLKWAITGGGGTTSINLGLAGRGVRKAPTAGVQS